MPGNVLLLQGPIGPFFKRFSDELEDAGNRVYKINFNGGDKLFYHSKNCFNFTGTKSQWPDYFEEKLCMLDIKKVYLFGDCREYHQLAHKLATKNSVKVFVFEEGYLRPNYITLEKNGVNGHSGIVRIADNYRKTHRSDQTHNQFSGSSFSYAVVYSILYYLASLVSKRKFPYYQHHRSMKIVPEGLAWIISGWRKIVYSITERKHIHIILHKTEKPVYLAVLQVHSDMQIKAHSTFTTVDQFISECMISFSRSAAKNTLLVFKHHPLDRGYTNYQAIIQQQAQQLGISERIIYIHDANLPSLLKRAKGVVTINSTVGLSALHHATPVKNLGYAVYDIPGLTFQGELSTFWEDPGEVDTDLFLYFRAWLMRNNQVKGSFYRRFTKKDTATGLSWPTKVGQLHFQPALLGTTCPETVQKKAKKSINYRKQTPTF